MLSLEVLKKAEIKLDAAKARVDEALKAVETAANAEPAERAKLELTRTNSGRQRDQ